MSKILKEKEVNGRTTGKLTHTRELSIDAVNYSEYLKLTTAASWPLVLRVRVDTNLQMANYF
jgi:hypothetical protein